VRKEPPSAKAALGASPLIKVVCRDALKPLILTFPYAAYSQIFSYAAVNVHQGGSGTIGEAMRSGRPMLVVPYDWDQPDNAARIERLAWAFTYHATATRSPPQQRRWTDCSMKLATQCGRRK